MKLQKKQISLILITLTASLIFLWQLIELLSNDIASKPKQMVATFSAPNTSPPVRKIAPENTKPNPQLQQVSPQQSSEQQAYLALINDYQTTKMQHKLLQEKLAVEDTRQKIAKLRHNTPPSLKNAALHNGFGTENTATQPITPLRLVYLDYQQGHWSAAINYRGHYQALEAGTTLADGTQVLAINAEGAIVQSGKHRLQINFNDARLLLPQKR